jgi:hypothetical protein
MLTQRWIAACLVAGSLLQSGQVLAQQKRHVVSFGTLEAASADEVRAQAAAWLKAAGKADAATTQKLDAIWKQADRPLLDRVAATLSLGDATAARLLNEAADPLTPAPTSVPEVFKDTKTPVFYRANLALTYARLLSNRRIHEEALAVLMTTGPEQVADPAAYLFHRAVCEHALLQRQPAGQTIGRLLDDTSVAPERYKTVGALMLLDMQTWKDKDLGHVARIMNNVERRLDLARGGPETQKQQKEIVRRLDEIIKELENKCKGCSACNGGGCPNGGQPSGGPPSGGNPSSPATQSGIANNGGPGRVDQAKLRNLQENWGNLPERDRVRALQDLTRGLSPIHREAIENYFRNIAQGSSRR